MSSIEIVFENLSVERSVILQSIKDHGILTTARTLGYDTRNYDNFVCAGRLMIYHLKMTTPKTLRDYIALMKDRLHQDVIDYIHDNNDILQKAIDDNDRLDYEHDWFSASTLIRIYLAKPKFDMEPTETPQMMYMRIAVQLYHKDAIEDVLKCYNEMSLQLYTHASPTLFNAGMKKPQMSSCFLITIDDDLESILYTGVGDAGMISKSNGGLGIDVSRVRHSEINGGGQSQGLVPMISMFNSMVRYVDQKGLRKGAATIYLRPHHLDVFEFCDLVNKIGEQYTRAHDINICLWMPWFFWERVRNGSTWTLMCPAKTPELNDTYGHDFKEKYILAEQRARETNREYLSINKEYEELLKGNDYDKIKEIKIKLSEAKEKRIPFKEIKAIDLLNHVVKTQRKTGMPYIMHGDACNIKSNQKNLGYIRCSNLCLEVVEYSSNDEIPSCNLASISLRAFCKGTLTPSSNIADIKESYDFKLLGQTTRSIVKNLNRVIDNNWYPLDSYNKDGSVRMKGKIHKSNKSHRPIGVGVSGFAEMLHELDLAFEDEITKVLNKMVFGCIYYNCLLESINLGYSEGIYDSFKGSPFSEGKLQFDLWSEEFKMRSSNPARKETDDLPIDPEIWGEEYHILSNGFILKPSWSLLGKAMESFGCRNSLLTALMPTASTAQIMRNAETTEAHMSNIYSRQVLNGGYPVINRYMVKDLQEINMWTLNIFDFIQSCNGSISKLHLYAQEKIKHIVNYERLSRLQQKYKTMWELPQKVLLQMTADRGRYIDQSQSTNIYISDPSDEQLKALHLYTDMIGLKTGMYYLRQNPASDTIKFTVAPEMTKFVKDIDTTSENSCKLEYDADGKKICLSCS